MSYVVLATWKAKSGEEAAVLGLLHTMAELSNREPGCILFRVHRLVADPSTFVLYEEYQDEAAFGLHTTSEHFQQYVLGDAVNRLAERRREILEIV